MDPRKRVNADIMNDKIKHREKWRPFACSILEEYAEDILDNYIGKSKPYFMVEAFEVKKEWAEKMQAVVHIADNTTRPQIVSKDYMSRYHK